MNLTGNILKGEVNKDEIQLHAQKEVKRKKEYIGRVKVYKGQKLWQLDLHTKEVGAARVDEFVTIKGRQYNKTRRADIKDGCLYVVAINKENACRKFLKMIDNI